MKNLIFAIVAILTVNFATAQTATEIDAAKEVVMSRLDQYNAHQKAVYVNGMEGINKVEATVAKQKLNYQKYSFVFNGEINDDNVIGGALNSYTQSTAKPFVYYAIVKQDGVTTVWVVAGHNGF